MSDPQSPTGGSDAADTRSHGKKGVRGGNTDADNYPSFLLEPPLEVHDPQGICGEFGPVHDVDELGRVVLCCTRRRGHDGPHRYQRRYEDRKWSYPYELELDEGRVLGSYRPHDRSRLKTLPGPRPIEGDPSASPDVEQRLEQALERLDELAAAEPEAQALEQSSASENGAQSDVPSVPELREISRVDELEQLDVPVCADVPVDELDEDACREFWHAKDEIHVCQRLEDHEDTSIDVLAVRGMDRIPKRHVCFCGTDTRSTTCGPLEPTRRPEPTLEEAPPSG